MSWVKLDDKVWSHPKFGGLTGNAVRLWMFALCWCNQHETDGLVPRRALALLTGSAKLAAELCAVGLWRVTDGGWSIHDYLVYQPSKASRDEAREQSAQRMAKSRRNRSDSCDDVAAQHAPKLRGGCERPDPDPDPEDLTTTTLKTPQVTALAELNDGGSDIPPKSAIRASEPPRQAEPNPRSHSAVLAIPIGERATWYLANLHQFVGGASDWAQPQAWPELVEAVTALHETAKLPVPVKLRPFAVDPRVKLLLSHFSVGHSLEDVVDVYRTVPKSEWWIALRAENKRPDASFVTTRVFEITLNTLRDGGKDAKAATKELARVRGARRLRETSAPSHREFAREQGGKSDSVMAPPAAAFAALRAVGGGSCG